MGVMELFRLGGVNAWMSGRGPSRVSEVKGGCRRAPVLAVPGEAKRGESRRVREEAMF